MRLVACMMLLGLPFGVSCRDSTAVSANGISVVWGAPRMSGGGDWILGTPAVDAGRLFIQEGNTLAGIDAATGRRLWTRQIRFAPTPIRSTPRAAGGHVYVSETDSLMAVDAATGATIWNVHPDSQAVIETALDADNFYSGQRGIPVVYAIARTSGTLRWKVNLARGYTFPAHVRGVAVSGDTVYASVERFLNTGGGTGTGVLVALDKGDGHELWRFETPAGKHYFLDAPIPAGARVIVNDVGSGDLAAIDIATRAEVWRTAVGAATDVLVIGSTVYSGGNDHVFALDLATGAVRWSSPSGSTSFGIGFCGGDVYSSAFVMRRFDGMTGALKGELGNAGGYVSHVASDGERAYATGSIGTVAMRCQ